MNEDKIKEMCRKGYLRRTQQLLQSKLNGCYEIRAINSVLKLSVTSGYFAAMKLTAAKESYGAIEKKKPYRIVSLQLFRRFYDIYRTNSRVARISGMNLFGGIHEHHLVAHHGKNGSLPYNRDSRKRRNDSVIGTLLEFFPHSEFP
ncbi:Hypothetical predicted protein [Octopus vulgaris]|uniref:Uncharacterized protein n=1 Tax=Octopus vulgaris TaxID=6645 RepID=A0AA36BGY3_OCTVU|nr:Hypothetical predicted protein [Octopus vulgaris]